MNRDRISDRAVLLAIASGLILIELALVAGIFTSPHALPNWAENVLISIGTAAALKLGDCLSTLVALSTGKSVERLGTQLGASAPVTPAPAEDPLPVQVVNADSERVPVAATA